MLRIAFFLAFLFLTHQTESATLEVGSNYSSISEAITFSIPGDVILVPGGIYDTDHGEQFPILMRSEVVLQAKEGEIPVIRGNGGSPLIVFSSVQSAVMDGFVLTGVVGPGSRGAVNAAYSSVTIRNCTFERNSSDQPDAAGGLYGNFGSILLDNCAFIENSATDHAEQAGGGAFLHNVDFVVRDCLFEKNQVLGEASAGGGLRTHGNGTIERCRFLENSVTHWGGGLWCDGADDLEISNCVFIGNSAALRGGGLYLFSTTAVIGDCGFYSNIATDPIGSGAVHVEVYRSQPVRIERCRFIGNAGFRAGALGTNRDAKVEVSNCLMVGNRGFDGGAVTSSEESFISLSFTSIVSTYPFSVFSEKGGAVEISNSLFADHFTYALSTDDSDSDFRVTHSLFFDAPEGVFQTPESTYRTVSEVEADRTQWSDNLEGDPHFAPLVEGTWTAAAVFDEDSYQTVLFDDTAAWEPDRFIGKTYSLNPNKVQPLHFAIVTNTSRSITVWGNAGYLGAAGNEYTLFDARPTTRSAAIDIADTTGPPIDFLGSSRPVDVFYKGRDETGDEYDIGALEVLYTFPFLNPRSDINRDGRVDSKDLLILQKSLED